MPNQPKTPNRSIRVSDELWSAAKKKAHDEGLTITELIIRLLRRYVQGYED